MLFNLSPLFLSNNLYKSICKCFLSGSIGDFFSFTNFLKKEKKKPNALFDDDLDFNNYLKTCYDRDPTLSKADIIVATIHGVKGMERKKVILKFSMVETIQPT